MVRIFLLLLLQFLIAFVSNAQINMADSTAQVITYWDKGEKQNYTVTVEKLKIKGADTTTREYVSYDVEITVLKAEDKSYTIEWLYKNMQSNNDNPVIQKIFKINNDMKVVYKTDELGIFVEVVNWKEIKDFIHDAMVILKKDYNEIPGMDKIFNQIEKTYSTKEAIESVSIADIQQFHVFHGGKYKLAEQIELSMKVPNLYGEVPFDSQILVYLDEVNTNDKNFIIRSSQEINSEQLTKATFDYLTKMANTLKTTPPKREDLKDLENQTLTSSRIHDTGWVIYSIQTKTVTSDNVSSVEERVIEIK
jgi:hypothetical protein